MKLERKPPNEILKFEHMPPAKHKSLRNEHPPHTKNVNMQHNPCPIFFFSLDLFSSISLIKEVMHMFQPHPMTIVDSM
jgi:hypothetical protein